MLAFIVEQLCITCSLVIFNFCVTEINIDVFLHKMLLLDFGTLFPESAFPGLYCKPLSSISLHLPSGIPKRGSCRFPQQLSLFLLSG